MNIIVYIPPDCRLRLDACEPAVNASGNAVQAASLLSSKRLPAGAVEFPDVAKSPGCRYNRKTTMEFESQGTFLNCAYKKQNGHILVKGALSLHLNITLKGP